MNRNVYYLREGGGREGGRREGGGREGGVSEGEEEINIY